MASTNFKLFDENKTNMMSDTEYNINTQRLNGVQAGIASSQLQNKTLYQTSLVAYSLAQIMMQNGYNANDSAAVSAFVGNMSNSLLQKVLDKATTAEAQNGVNNTKWMTPSLTKAAIDILAAKSQNILSDETKTLYGLGVNAVPNDVLAVLGKYKQYWWRRRLPAGEQYVEHKANITGNETLIIIRSSSKIQYASAVDISPDGNVTLENPTDYTTSWLPVYTYVSGLAALAPCYVKSSSDDVIYYLPEGATATSTGDTDKTLAVTNSGGDDDYDYIYFGKYATPIAKVVTAIAAVVPAGDWQYLQSSNRNAYPDSGTQDGYEYEYLGIPFDNAVTAPKIETGSYVGTGTYGSGGKNSLTFGFVPAILIITADYVNNHYVNSGYIVCNSGGHSGQNGNIEAIVDGNTVSWYSGNNAQVQLNTSGLTYKYVAIG